MMSETDWTYYMQLLAASPQPLQPHCVACWYERHDEPFPAQDSSSLCDRHVQAHRRARTAQSREVQR